MVRPVLIHWPFWMPPISWSHQSTTRKNIFWVSPSQPVSLGAVVPFSPKLILNLEVVYYAGVTIQGADAASQLQLAIADTEFIEGYISVGTIDTDKTDKTKGNLENNPMALALVAESNVSLKERAASTIKEILYHQTASLYCSHAGESLNSANAN